MSITERLANLSTWSVLITMAVLFVARWLLLKQRSPAAKSVAEICESLAVAMGLVFLLIRPFVVQAFFIPSASMHPTLLERDHILVNKFLYRFREPRLGDVVVFKAPPAATPDGLEKDFIKRVIAVPGDTVRITPGYVMVGNTQYSHENLREMLGQTGEENRVKLVGKAVFVNGRPMSDTEIAAAFNQPNAKVKVMPGIVYLNGKPLTESYTAEDPDLPYPLGTTDPSWIITKKVGKDEEQLVKIPKGKLLVMGDNRNDSNDARFWGLLDRDRILGKAMFIFWPLNRIRWVH